MGCGVGSDLVDVVAENVFAHVCIPIGEGGYVAQFAVVAGVSGIKMGAYLGVWDIRKSSLHGREPF